MEVKSWKNVPGFKIRKKSDVYDFIDVILKSGTFIYENETHDEQLIIIVHGTDRDICIRRGNLRDIFNPQLVLYGQRAIDHVWKYRKQINADLFTKMW